MKASNRLWCRQLLALAAVAVLAGCGSDSDGDDSGGTSATPTRTATIMASPTPTSVAATPSPSPTGAPAVVAGLVVVDRSVSERGAEDLGLPPPGWLAERDAEDFDRALSHADWFVEGDEGYHGVTGSDGRFEIRDLAPGRYVLHLTKTIGGDLAPIRVPLTVGDDGAATVLAEVVWGLARSTSTYVENGAPVREVHGPYGAFLVTRGDRISEIGDPGRRFVDADGDGSFEPMACVEQAWECPADRACGEDRFCACTASCPFCEDCGPPVCVPRGTSTPYLCNPDGSCAQPADRCICVSSCPECDDCRRSVCVPGCEPVEIVAVSIQSGPARLVVGERSPLYAVAQLSDGTTIDVTHLVSWESSDASVVRVDSWGTVTAQAVGRASLTAGLDGLSSEPLVIHVVDRPQLRAIHLQNASCWIIFPVADSRPGILPVPSCRQVVRVGASIQFRALGEFDNQYFQDITSEVQWRLQPPGVGEVSDGLFTAIDVGSVQLTAALGTVVSEVTQIRVVSEPTVVALNIFPATWGFGVIDGGPIREDAALPCFDCRSGLTVLRGDELPFRATAEYDTGDWVDVTARVTWRSSDQDVAPITAGGLMTAAKAGMATIDAVLAEVTSNPVDVRVVDEATLLSLSIYQEGNDRVAAKGEQLFFRAVGYYDVSFARDVTAEANWRSADEAVGRFEAPGVFGAAGAGTTSVWAELPGQRSESIGLEVYETSTLDYCDPEHINRGLWSDYFNRVTLESDCGTYSQPSVVNLRYTVTEVQPHGGIFDPCLDLYVYRGRERVRTIREEGCGDPFLAAGAPSRDAEVLKYQLRAFWDLKAEDGSPVPPGRYTIYGRFYLYYDPVVSIDVIVQDNAGRIPCEETTCGNGCGYVHTCGNTDRPQLCPAVCTQICECPPGWGITPDGDCEPCLDDCCPVGSACPPGMPECALACCPANARCAPEIPPCAADCCPRDALCPFYLPPCEVPPDCCPLGVFCGPLDLPPCEPPVGCCRPGELCIPELLPCRIDFN